ncbi:MAG: zinc metallopeptidase [Planctomycetota bacterium]|jgi:Zn-dependent membrane protease YugP|nr:zinc metallopeptidase [Planctomycetota bacterium]
MLFDPIYWLLVGVCALLSLGAGALTKLRFNRASKIPTRGGRTGAQVAAEILRESGIDDVSIREHQGFLSDHYNPMTKTLALSPKVYHGRSIAAAAVAAHEVGHAIQHAHAYLPLNMRSILVPIANIGSFIGPWIIIAAIFMGGAQAGGMGLTLAWVGVALFGAGTVFTFITLPVEFDASNRAKALLPQLGLTAGADEDRGVAKVLNAAAMTYLAAAASSLIMLLYWANQAGLLGGRRD